MKLGVLWAGKVQSGHYYMGFLSFQAKEAILEMDSYCKLPFSACFVPNCVHC